MESQVFEFDLLDHSPQTSALMILLLEAGYPSYSLRDVCIRIKDERHLESFLRFLVKHWNVRKRVD